MASGNQVNSGICALLPQAPMNRKIPANVNTPVTVQPANTPLASTVSPFKFSSSPFNVRKLTGPYVALSVAASGSACTSATRAKMPMMNPKSPMRLKMNAFMPAAAKAFFSDQKPISR